MYANLKCAGSDLNQRPRHVKVFYVKGVTTSCNGDDGGDLGRRFQSDPAAITCSQQNTDSNDLWLRFEQYILEHQNPRTVRDTLRYAKRYAYILEHCDAQDLLYLQNEKKTHIM